MPARILILTVLVYPHAVYQVGRPTHSLVSHRGYGQLPRHGGGRSELKSTAGEYRNLFDVLRGKV